MEKLTPEFRKQFRKGRFSWVDQQTTRAIRKRFDLEKSEVVYEVIEQMFGEVVVRQIGRTNYYRLCRKQDDYFGATK